MPQVGVLDGLMTSFLDVDSTIVEQIVPMTRFTIRVLALMGWRSMFGFRAVQPSFYLLCFFFAFGHRWVEEWIAAAASRAAMRPTSRASR